MPTPTYDLIRPLVVEYEAHGTNVEVLFQCPVKGVQLSSSAIAQQGITSRAADHAKRSLMWTVRREIGRALRSAFGYGFAGRLASNVVRDATSKHPDTTLSQGEIEAAIIEAFRRVQGQFAWDTSNNRYVSLAAQEELQTEFLRLVTARPVDQPWDKTVLARMITEIAAVDGVVLDSEREFYHDFITEGSGTLEELLQRPPLTERELQQTKPIARETLFAVSAAVAMADERFAASEKARLDEYAAALNLDDEQVDKLMGWARDHVVDQMLEAFYYDGEMTDDERNELTSLANSLGVDSSHLDELDGRCRLRRGL